jgi:hypothetical protein
MAKKVAKLCDREVLQHQGGSTMSLRDRLSGGDAPDREQEQRKRARKAARKDARKGIPGNLEHPEVPPFVQAWIDEWVGRVADALKKHILEARPHWTVIAARTAQIADADAKIQKLEQLLADAPRPTSSHSAKDAFRLQQEQERLARAPRLELEETQKARDAARADLCGAKEAANASFRAYRALRMDEEAHARAVLWEGYVAELLRCCRNREALEKSLKPAIEAAFAEALRKLDEDEKFILNGQQPFGP